MHLLAIAAFAVLFWRAESEVLFYLVPRDDVIWTLAIVLGGGVAVSVAALATRAYARRLEHGNAGAPFRAVEFHHRAMFVLRWSTTVLFAASVMLTPWADWFNFTATSPWLQVFGDLLVLSPFLAESLLLWVIAYPLERRFRQGERSVGETQTPWRLAAYLDFNIRHHLLVVAGPMTLILFAANVIRGYERVLRVWSGWVWAPDLALGAVAAGVFLCAPLLLRRIWRTSPLPAGPLRDRLDDLCRRIGLRCRDILVWKSDGIMINAAVMGIVPAVRYVLLSDALLATMTDRQVEAVFGHEAGHIRYRHIQHFLLFAFVGWIAVAGLMELLANGSRQNGGSWPLSVLAIEGVGAAATIAIWAIGFGWVSRRFERQADLFGARCVTPSASDCDRPCSVHLDSPAPAPQDGRICATAAAVFASALHRVAVLNGIPAEERSWRHSSIGSRIRFLTSLAGDPRWATRFERSIQQIKAILLVAAILGGLGAAWYWWVVPQPALFRLQASGFGSP